MKIYYTPKAQEDLMHIKERVIETWANEELAVKVLKRITGAVKRLEAFPYIGLGCQKAYLKAAFYLYLENLTRLCLELIKASIGE